jgi:hypothetical protein
VLADIVVFGWSCIFCPANESGDSVVFTRSVREWEWIGMGWDGMGMDYLNQ